MARRICAEKGCPVPVDEGTRRCPAHERARDHARGTRRQRGYDTRYDRARKRVKPSVDAGLVTCWRCDKPIRVGQVWNLGHCDDDRTTIHGPEHEACNLAHTRGGCTHISHVTSGGGG